MARQETIVQVLVASPSDVKSEREALEHIIRELNVAWSQSLAVRLELIRWETHVVPGFGTDPQEVINSQIGQDYDVFLGILWARHGSPTPRAESGTQEEFDRAIRKSEADPNVQVVLYFKDAPVPPSQLDPAQLAKVQAFKKHVSDRGVLYKSFVEIGEFESAARIHLSKIVQRWVKSPTMPVADQPLSVVHGRGAEPPASDFDEPGFIDLLEASLEHMVEAASVTEKIGEITAALGHQVDARTKAFEELAQAGRGDDLKARKRITNLAADDMDQFVARMRLEIPIFAKHYEMAIGSFSRAVSMTPELSTSSDSSPENLTSLRQVADMLAGLVTSMKGGNASMRGLRDTINGLPRMTTVFNRSKRVSVSVLDQFLHEVESAISLTLDAERSVREIISQLNPRETAQRTVASPSPHTSDSFSYDVSAP